MRYLLGFLFVSAPLVTLAQSVDAQTGEEAVTKLALAMHTQHRLPPQLMLRASYYLYLDADADNSAASDQGESSPEQPKSARADGEVTSPESNLEESLSSPAPGTEAPDIDTLSQRAIENYETQSAQTHTQGRRRRGTGGRSRGAKAGIAVGVIVGVGLLVFGIAAAVAVSNSFDDL
jgi:hypothetical protein